MTTFEKPDKKTLKRVDSIIDELQYLCEKYDISAMEFLNIVRLFDTLYFPKSNI